MMRNDPYSKGSSDFPYRLLRILGWAILILSVITLLLGVVDIGWTAGNYLGNNCNSENDHFDTFGLPLPCGDDSLIWSWIASPIWASLFVIITGVIGTRFSRYRTGNLKFHRDIFAIMCVLACILWGPAIIVLTSLEVVYGQNVFYYMNNDDVMQFGDIVKVVIPLLIIVFAFFTWVVAIVGMCVTCCCAPVLEDGMELISPPSVRPTPRQAPMMPRPAPQPMMTMQSMPSYPSYPAYPYYGYPYYGAYGNYGYGRQAMTGAAQQTSASMYGGTTGQGGYGTALTNALVPYSGGNYGGRSYGLYGTPEIAASPYI